MASSQGLLWRLGTHRLGLGDGSINCAHHPVPWGKVHDLRVLRMKLLRGRFTKGSEEQVVLSKGWSRPKLQNVQGHHGVGRAGLSDLPAERRGGKQGPSHGRTLCSPRPVSS